MTETLNGMVDFSGPAYRKLFGGLFDGTRIQLLNELLQNAQRAGATHIDFSYNTDTRTFRISDNGRGLVSCGLPMPTDADMIALLMTTRTAHPANVVEEQSPMGLGFLSVLAHEDTETVEVVSGYAGLVVDTGRWWNDFDYRDMTRQRITWHRERVDGMTLYVTGWKYGEIVTELSKLVHGYRDLLTVTVDGTPLGAHPDYIRHDYGHPVFDNGRTVVKVNPTGAYSSHVTINFWGQVITAKWDLPWSASVHIREAAPFDFITPVRTGVILNSRWTAWTAEMKQTILRYFSDRAHRHLVKPSEFSSLVRMDSTWSARVGCALWAEAEGDEMDDEWYYRSGSRSGRERVVWVDDLPEDAFLLSAVVRLEVVDEHGHCEEDEGISDIVDFCIERINTPRRKAYFHRDGVRVPAHLVVWMTQEIPQPVLKSRHFELGEWALEDPEGNRATLDMEGVTVISIMDACWDWNAGYGLIIKQEKDDSLTELLDIAARAVVEYHDYHGWDESSSEEYWREFAVTRAKLAGDELPMNWNWDVLEEVAGQKVTRVEKLDNVHEGFFRRRKVWLATFEDGTQKEFSE